MLHGKQQAAKNVTEGGGHGPAPAGSRSCQILSLDSGFSVKDIRNGLWNLPPQLRRTIEAKHGMHQGCPQMEA